MLAGMLLLSFTHSCIGPWRVEEGDAKSVIETKERKEIRLWRPDGSTTHLENPRIEGDSVVGVQVQESRGVQVRQQLAVPLDDISAVETRGVNAVSTSFAVLGIGLGLAALVAAATADRREGKTSCSPIAAGGDPSECSCPFVYSWDGERWRLDSGTFGGAITRGAARTDVDNLIYATPTDGVLRLKLANELQETDYVDALSVVAVDHARDVTVAPDGSGHLYTIGESILPTRALDFRGRDVLGRIAAPDGVSWESSVSGRDTSRVEDLRDGLELTFARPPEATEARLVLDGHDTGWAAMMLGEWISAHGSATQAWYDSLDTQPQMLRQLAGVMAHTGFLGVSVWTGDRWAHQGHIMGASPELIKRQVFALELGVVEGDTVRVRLESAPSFWRIDHVALDVTPPQPTEVHELELVRATDHGGRDVTAVLGAIDGDEYVLETGDYAELAFEVPPVPVGKARSYVLQSTGWYRIHSPTTDAPQVALLERLTRDPTAASREAVGRMNELLQVLGSASR